MSFVPGCW